MLAKIILRQLRRQSSFPYALPDISPFHLPSHGAIIAQNSPPRTLLKDEFGSTETSLVSGEESGSVRGVTHGRVVPPLSRGTGRYPPAVAFIVITSDCLTGSLNLEQIVIMFEEHRALLRATSTRTALDRALRPPVPPGFPTSTWFVLRAGAPGTFAPRAQHQVRMEYRVRAATVTLVERRVPGNAPDTPFGPEWTARPVGQLRLDQGQRLLWWPDRNSRWHLVEDVPASVSVVLLLEERLT